MGNLERIHEFHVKPFHLHCLILWAYSTCGYQTPEMGQYKSSMLLISKTYMRDEGIIFLIITL